MDQLAETFRNKRVWITGHTGFKGAWLTEWLLGLGAKVSGFSLPPPTTPALFEQLDQAQRIHHQEGDVRDAAAVRAAVQACQPDFVFHLAAQSLVRVSYADPAGTFATNVDGTIHVLEALRTLDRPCVAVFVTSDKCYANDHARTHREEDPLGGRDPYSASKAAAELAVASWRSSFFSGPEARVAIASARAGNVIGGGDWAADRILPDCVRSWQAGRPVAVRHAAAVRPWQHVVEPLAGYLMLAARLHQAGTGATELRSAFNFGPLSADQRTVADLVEAALRTWPGSWEKTPQASAPAEAHFLSLDSAKADRLLGWRPRWNFDAAVKHAVEWYRAVGTGADPAEWTRRQIRAYGPLS
jgi:CDP-glucose 4,6-dehydratase